MTNQIIQEQKLTDQMKLLKVSQSLASVSSRILECQKAFKIPYSVNLLAVSKRKPHQMIRYAYEAGQRSFGQNYIQELCQKHQSLPHDIKWHMIGHVQTNKVKQLLSVPNLFIIETVDSMKLAQKLQSQAEGRQNVLKVLIQVQTSDEGTKNGLEPDKVMELVEYIVKKCQNIQFNGLMTMGKVGDQKSFEIMRGLRDQIKAALPQLNERPFLLSMGTSQDYDKAIENGSTQIRVGTQIFGKRDEETKA